MKKTYKELIEEILTDEIDELYCYLEKLTEKICQKMWKDNSYFLSPFTLGECLTVNN